VLLNACATRQEPWTKPKTICGELVVLPAHDNATIAYSYREPAPPRAEPSAVFVMLPGISGKLMLDKSGCVRSLKGNSLIRTMARFLDSGYAVAMVDAPSDHTGPDGLAEFRTAPEHATDLGGIITDIRSRTNRPIVLASTSRGAISAVNAASRLHGQSAPDALILTSPLSLGREYSYKSLAMQSVFDLPLHDITAPTLILVHDADQCPRTPPERAILVLEKLGAKTRRLVSMSGGPMAKNPPAGMDACRGQTPHGFIGQDAEMVEILVEFARHALRLPPGKG
jgi:hypothetical protein